MSVDVMTAPSPFEELYRRKLAEGHIRADEGQDAALAPLAHLYESLVRRAGLLSVVVRRRAAPEKQGVYLWGGVGRGKTMLMDLFCDSLPDSVTRRRVHFHEFMIGVHDFLHKARQAGDAESALLKYARTVARESRVLCFDEFHVTDITDAMILGRLFTVLLDHGTAVVATSNWPPEKLYEGGLQRDRFLPFIALLQEKLEIVELKGKKDYRLECLTEAGVYFSPLNAAAQRRADEVFARLTGGAPVYAETLTVKGRALDVVATARGVARFSFAQLCERPTGAEDYLSIARVYHTVFLEHVPRLGYDRRNEAKRLMILVDTLYDSGTKLVVTADAPPEGLYRGGDHAFEFQRTVSRLIEMQTSAYLARSSRPRQPGPKKGGEDSDV